MSLCSIFDPECIADQYFWGTALVGIIVAFALINLGILYGPGIIREFRLRQLTRPRKRRRQMATRMNRDQRREHNRLTASRVEREAHGRANVPLITMLRRDRDLL